MKEKMQAQILEYINNKTPIFPVLITAKPTSEKPLGAEKKPLVQWGQVTSESRYDFSNANAIGIPTGKKTGVFVLDLDLGADLMGRQLPVTVCQKTGSGGMHYFFKMIDGVVNKEGLEYRMDIRGEGGFVVLAPSWHPGGEYEWVIAPGEVPYADAPAWLLEKMKIRKKHDPKLAFGCPEGTRNGSAASIIGHILSLIHENYWLDFGLGGLREWNKRNTPPLPDEELVAVFKSIATRQYAKRK
jgi:hypothetical protein